MKYNKFVKDLGKNSIKLLLVMSCLLSFAFGWQGKLMTAYAAPLTINSPIFLANLGNSGVENQAKGHVQQEIGKAQNRIDKLDQQVDRSYTKLSGNADEINPKIKEYAERSIQNLDSTENKAQKNVHGIGDAAENALDKVKDFLTQEKN